jgi:hypothetical protein
MKRSHEAQTYIEPLCQVEACIARAHTLVQGFLSMVREGRGDDLKAWMASEAIWDELATFGELPARVGQPPGK